jgi:hypothetical protein
MKLHKNFLIVLISLVCFLFSCEMTGTGSKNPAAEGFNIEGSDPEAVALADKVMEEMGGRYAIYSVEFFWRT